MRSPVNSNQLLFFLIYIAVVINIRKTGLQRGYNGAPWPSIDTRSHSELTELCTLNKGILRVFFFNSVDCYCFCYLTVQIPVGNENYRWIKANVGQTGFYRVNYGKKNWDRLIKQLKTNHKAGRQLLLFFVHSIRCRSRPFPIVLVKLALMLLMSRTSRVSSDLLSSFKIIRVLKSSIIRKSLCSTSFSEKFPRSYC